MNNKPITHLIVDTSGSDEDFNGGCDYCLVEMTAEYISWLLRHTDRVARLRKIDDSAYVLECWDATPQYFCDNDGLAKLIDLGDVNLHSGAPLFLDAAPEIDEEYFQRIEGHAVRISEDGVCWTACPKHTNISVTSTSVRRETLLEILDSFGQTHSPCTIDGDSVARQIHDLLYLDFDDDRECYNPRKEWDVDMLSMIADIVDEFIPRPTSDLEADCSPR
jgi:hypothetical protein